LKAGFLVGATPRNQQKALLVGVLVSVFAIGVTLNLMNRGLESIKAVKPVPVDVNALPEGVRVIGDQDNDLLKRHEDLQVVGENGQRRTIRAENYKLLTALGSSVIPNGQYLYNPASGQIEVQWQQGIGSADAAAPQANLMATVVNGILTRRLPWNLVLIGVFIVIAVELLGIRSLSFAVGFYLSIATTLAIFAGGVVRWMVDANAKRRGEALDESEVSPGSLFASGLIAAGGVVGLLGIAIKVGETTNFHGHKLITPGVIAFGQKLPTANMNWLGVLTFVALAAALYHYARKPIGK
jgi:uncharacterized oligopeptide transporter (OPT) family protein